MSIRTGPLTFITVPEGRECLDRLDKEARQNHHRTDYCRWETKDLGEQFVAHVVVLMWVYHRGHQSVDSCIAIFFEQVPLGQIVRARANHLSFGDFPRHI